MSRSGRAPFWRTTRCHTSRTVPKLEFPKLVGVGLDLHDDGLVRLFETMPYIRRVDLEDASDIADAVLAALTPHAPPLSTPSQPTHGAPHTSRQPGLSLKHLVVSYAGELTNDALQALIRNCTRLLTLEADNTRMNSPMMRDFAHRSRKRPATDATLVAVNCGASASTRSRTS